MSIVAMIFVVGIVAMRSGDDEAKFRESITQVEGFSKRARSLSLMQRRSYQLVFDEFGITLEPVFGDPLEEEEEELSLFDQDEEIQRPQRFEMIRDRFDLPEGMTLEVKGWNQDWLVLERDNTFVWEFRPEGLVEPVEVRIRAENGWIKHRYNPLTGAMAEERYEFQ